MSALVDRKAAVGVAVVGEAHVEAVADDEVLQALDVGRAAVDVDVEAVGRVVDDVRLGAHGVEDRLGDRGGRAVGAVETDLDALHREAAGGDQVRDVAVAALHVVDRAADGVLRGQRHLELAVDVVLDLLEDVLVHLVALGVDELDAVVGVGVVRRGDHDAAVEGALGGLVGEAGRGDDVQHVGVGAGGDEAGDERALEHVARATRVLAKDDAGLLALAGAVVPADEPADLIGVVHAEALVGPAAESISAEVLHE